MKGSFVLNVINKLHDKVQMRLDHLIHLIYGSCKDIAAKSNKLYN